jgi:electron transfer flavoprotein beta subunit
VSNTARDERVIALNILVCVKQVPDTTDIKINPETNTLIREGVPSIVNTFDGYALEMAARVKDSHPDTKIVVVCMGPDQAKIALRDCLAQGGDAAYLVTDRAFGGSDTLATSYILKSAMSAIEQREGKFDVIFCGKQAIDGDTAQVGPELAEHLDYPQLTCVREVAVEGGYAIAQRETEYGREIWDAPLPAVITITKPDFEPRRPNILNKLFAARAPINVLTFDDVPAEREKCGLMGSPTKVKTSFVPPRKGGGIVFRDENFAVMVKKLAEALVEKGLI